MWSCNKLNLTAYLDVECDPSCAMQARFEFDVACSEDLVVNVKPRVVPYVFLV